MIGAPKFPAGVKFLIGVFPDLFGTAAGRRLQSWAMKWVRTSPASYMDHRVAATTDTNPFDKKESLVATLQGWVLVWALGSNLPDDDLNFYGPRNQTEFPGNSRLIDPQVIYPSNARTLCTVGGWLSSLR